MIVFAFLALFALVPSHACVSKAKEITNIETPSDFAGEPNDLNYEGVDEEYVPSEDVDDSMRPSSISKPEDVVQDVVGENEIPSEVVDNSTQPTERTLVQNFGNDDMTAKIVQEHYFKTGGEDNSNDMSRHILRFMGEDSNDENDEILDEETTI